MKAGDVAAMLVPLIEQAEREDKLLVAAYDNLTFTPNELRRANAEGRFCWDPVNWSLVTRASVIKDYEGAVKTAQAELEAALKRFAP